MARNYTRAQQRKYREERKRQAARVADRLLGKKKVDPVESFFGGTSIQTPFQYQNNLNFYNQVVRPSLIPYEGLNKVNP